MLNQVILVGQVDQIMEDDIMRIAVDGSLIQVYLTEEQVLNLPDSIEDLDHTIGVKGHLEVMPDGNAIVVADKLMLMYEGAADEGRYS